MHSLRFSRADDGAPDTPKIGVLCHPSSPFSGRTDSRAVQGHPGPPPRGTETGETDGCYKEKRTLPRTTSGVSKFIYVAIPTDSGRRRGKRGGAGEEPEGRTPPARHRSSPPPRLPDPKFRYPLAWLRNIDLIPFR